MESTFISVVTPGKTTNSAEKLMNACNDPEKCWWSHNASGFFGVAPMNDSKQSESDSFMDTDQ